MKTLFGRIPPVGNSIALGPRSNETSMPSDYPIHYVQSGTAALALAIEIAKQHNRVSQPEVVLPSYCCPDVLSAIVYCGAKPIVVDIEKDKPRYDLALLEQAINQNTIAVIAINFLGIPEQLKTIKKLLNPDLTILIEDSAQWFPPTPNAFFEHEGDIIVYSFGKGKPVGLMGGGATLVKNHLAGYPTPSYECEKEPFFISEYVKLITYNLVISRFFYWILEFIPFIEQGKTKYKTLRHIKAMPRLKKSLLKTNIQKYQRECLQNSEKIQNYISQLQSTKNIIIPLNAHSPPICVLRLPILIKAESTKKRLLSMNKSKGLGLSGFYPSPLPEIEGVPDIFNNQEHPNAKQFATELMTLPTHYQATPKKISEIAKLIRESAQ